MVVRGRLPPSTGILKAAGMPGYLVTGGGQDAQFARLYYQGLGPSNLRCQVRRGEVVPTSRDEASEFPEAGGVAKRSRSPAVLSLMAGHARKENSGG